MIHNDSRLMTTEEVAERYRTSASTVRYWRSIGYGPRGRRVGRRVLYEESEVTAFWESLASTRSGSGRSSGSATNRRKSFASVWPGWRTCPPRPIGSPQRPNGSMPLRRSLARSMWMRTNQISAFIPGTAHQSVIRKRVVSRAKCWPTLNGGVVTMQVLPVGQMTELSSLSRFMLTPPTISVCITWLVT